MDVLTLGASGLLVEAWQAFLVAQDCRDAKGRVLGIDGRYGARTAEATEAFAGRHGAAGPDVTDAMWAAAVTSGLNLPADLPRLAIPFLQARYFTPTQGRAVRWVVLHAMEVADKPTTAENVAANFAREDRKASAHYCVDQDSAVQCVRERDVAWHAPGANRDGLGIEHAGFTSPAAADWASAASKATLARSVALCADICRRHGIVPRALTIPADLNAGRSGITTHDLVSRTFRRSTHTDPGAGFPLDAYVSAVAARLAGP